MTPFDYVKSINNKTEQIDDLEGYHSYIINLALSLYDDTIFHANKMNLNPNLSKDLQYDYYYNAIRKKKRYVPWPKKPKEDEDLQCISEYYKYNMRRSKEALKILSSTQIKTIKEKINLGGT